MPNQLFFFFLNWDTYHTHSINVSVSSTAHLLSFVKAAWLISFSYPSKRLALIASVRCTKISPKLWHGCKRHLIPVPAGCVNKSLFLKHHMITISKNFTGHPEVSFHMPFPWPFMHCCFYTMTQYHAWWYCESQMAVVQKALCWAIFFTYTLKSKLFISNCTFVRQLVLPKLQVLKITHARPEKKTLHAVSDGLTSFHWSFSLYFFFFFSPFSFFFFPLLSLICSLAGFLKQEGRGMSDEHECSPLFGLKLFPRL